MKNISGEPNFGKAVQPAIESVDPVSQTVSEINLVLAPNDEIVERMWARTWWRKAVDKPTSLIEVKQFCSGTAIRAHVSPETRVLSFHFQPADRANTVLASANEIRNIAVVCDLHDFPQIYTAHVQNGSFRIYGQSVGDEFFLFDGEGQMRAMHRSITAVDAFQ